jgi:hypothetical protein
VTIALAPIPPPIGLLTATPALPPRLIDQVNDTVTLYQVRSSALFHLQESCRTIPGWQQKPTLTQTPFSALAAANLCPRCTSDLLNTTRRWAQCPPDLLGDPQLVAGNLNGPFHILRPVTQLLTQCVNALGAQFGRDTQAHQRFMAVVPAPLFTWLKCWTPYSALYCVSRVTAADTPAVLALAVGLWDPWSKSLLSEPLAALDAAHQISATPAP